MRCAAIILRTAFAVLRAPAKPGLAIACALALAACGAKQPPSRIAPDDAIFYVKANVADASVYVDGRYIGTTKYVSKGIAVSPGKHRLELRHDDYFSRYVQLDLRKAERKQLDLVLARILP